jgi:hypothetical protein
VTRRRWEPKEQKDHGRRGRCQHCGKWRYETRRHAKDFLRWARGIGSDDGRMSVYECDGFWHVGHLPDDVRHGHAPRSVMRDEELHHA